MILISRNQTAMDTEYDFDFDFPSSRKSFLSVKRKCDWRHHCCLTNGRPTMMPIIVLVLTFLGTAILMLPMGIVGLYRMQNQIETVMNVTNYDVQAKRCLTNSQEMPWIVFIKAQNIAINNTYKIYDNSELYVCGWYANSALLNAKAKYPVEKGIKIWYWKSDPSYVTFRSEEQDVMLFWVSLVFGLLSLPMMIIHSVSVICFGFASITNDIFSCRIRDPYRKANRNQFKEMRTV